jgi:hypothetical protein
MNPIQQIQQILGVATDGDFGPLSYTALTAAKQNPATVQAIQAVLGVAQDGSWGPVTQAAFQSLVAPSRQVGGGPQAVIASSFADPKDVAAFRQCIAEGNTEKYCLSVGDNGVGCWGDDCTGPTLCCALPPEIWLAKWGSGAVARGKPVIVTCNGVTVTALLWDTMPHLANITNGAGLDMGPALVAAVGLTPPVMVAATWQWA